MPRPSTSRIPETEKLTQLLARRPRQGIIEAVAEALRKEVERERRRPRRESYEKFKRDIDEIVERVRSVASAR